MNYEDLKPCPICGARCSAISIDCNTYGFCVEKESAFIRVPLNVVFAAQR